MDRVSKTHCAIRLRRSIFISALPWNDYATPLRGVESHIQRIDGQRSIATRRADLRASARAEPPVATQLLQQRAKCRPPGIDISRAQSVGIHAYLDLRVGEAYQVVEHLTNADTVAAADIVGLARPAADSRSPVGVGDVPHVGEIPDRLEIADGHHRWVEAALDPRDLTGEARGGELRRAARDRCAGRDAVGSSGA